MDRRRFFAALVALPAAAVASLRSKPVIVMLDGPISLHKQYLYHNGVPVLGDRQSGVSRRFAQQWVNQAQSSRADAMFGWKDLNG